MSRPQPLAVLVKEPEPTVPDAKGLIVHLDPVAVEWTSSGRNVPVSVFLENVDSGKRTPKKSVASDVRSILFESSEVLQATSVREYGKRNRVRAVVEWSTNRSVSESKDVAV